MTTFATTHRNTALAGNETQPLPAFFAIPITVGSALKSQDLIGDPWSCSVSGAIAQEIGVGAQVRICRNSEHCAVFTITEVRESDADGQIRLSKAARQRLGTSQSGFSATLRQALATTSLSESQAKNAEEFIERIQDDGDHQGLLILAPHGGAIEINTDRQARRVANTLAGADVSTWCCNGYNQGGSAFDRWHVTSTLIHPTSFPGLAQVTKRDYAYSVAFHGMSDPGVRIGGGGPSWLKQQLRDEIKSAIGGTAGSVKIAGPGQSLSGSSPANVTNWVTADGAGGVQIEQSYTVRSKHWRDVADAVACVFSELV